MLLSTLYRNKFSLTALLSLALAATVAAEENRTDAHLGIATGGEGGTYITMGGDIKKLVDSTLEGIEISVLATAGTTENIQRVLNSDRTQLAIIQADAIKSPQLTQIGAFKNRSITDLRFLLGLYPEEVHILARRGEFKSFQDLDGKLIATGKTSGGTAITLSRLQQIVGINPNWDASLSGVEAIDAVAEGKVDAFIYVSGQPVKLFDDYMSAPGKNASNFEFLPILNNNVFSAEGYEKTTLSGDTYFFLDNPVQTASVRSILVTADYRVNNEKCVAVGKVANHIKQRLALIKSRGGHAKWDQVEFESGKQNWKKSPCLKWTPGETPPSPDEQDPVPPVPTIPDIDD